MSFISRSIIFRFMNHVANKVNYERIKEVGCDRAAAEWLLRNGATFKFSHSDSIYNDYNKLPSIKSTNCKITEIYNLESSLMDHGFDYLNGLNDLKKIKIHNNDLITDLTLKKLNFVKKTLEELSLNHCSNLTDPGIKVWFNLGMKIFNLNIYETNNFIPFRSNLKYLSLANLKSVRNKEDCLKYLSKSLKNCEIDWRI